MSKSKAVKKDAASAVTEPLWAQGKSITQLKKVCRQFNVKDYEDLDRAGLIQKCSYLSIHPDFKFSDLQPTNPEYKKRKDLLQGKCTRGKPADKKTMAMDEDELVNCIVNVQAVRWMATMQTVAYKKFAEQLDTLKTLTKEEKNLMLEEHKAGEKQLMQFYNSQPDLDEKTEKILMIVGLRIRDEFQKSLKEWVEAVKTIAVETPNSEATISKGYLSKLTSLGIQPVKLAWLALKSMAKGLWKLAEIGFDFIKYIMTHPSTARIMAYIALSVKRRLCREISIYAGTLKFQQGTGFSDSVKASAKDILSHGKEMVFHTATSFFKGDGFNTLWGKVSGVVKMGLMMTISLVPGVGPVLAPALDLVLDAISEIGKESTKFALETQLYQENVSSTVRHLLDLFNPADCLQKGVTVRRAGEDLKDAGVSAATSARIAQTLDSWGWITQSSEEGAPESDSESLQRRLKFAEDNVKDLQKALAEAQAYVREVEHQIQLSRG